MNQVIAFKNATSVGPTELPVSADNPLPISGTIVATPGPPEPVVPGVGTKATFVQGSVLPVAAGTPERLAAPGTYVSSVTLFGQRLARVPNTDPVWFGSTSADDSQLVQLTPGTAEFPNGSAYSFTAPPGRVIDLGDIYVDVETAGDGVTYLGVL